MKLQFWKLRITVKYLKISKIEILDRLKEISSTYLIINEFWDDKGNPLDHIQSYFETDLSERKLRTLVKSFLTEGGNKSFSMDNRHTDWNGYKGYLLKYDDTDILGSSYTPEEITHFKEYYKKVSKPKLKPRKEMKLENDLEEILQIMQNRDDNKYTIKEILKTIIQYYKDNKKVIHLANINQLAWSVKTYTDSEDELIDKLLHQDEAFYKMNAEEERSLKIKFDGRIGPDYL